MLTKDEQTTVKRILKDMGMGKNLKIKVNIFKQVFDMHNKEIDLEIPSVELFKQAKAEPNSKYFTLKEVKRIFAVQKEKGCFEAFSMKMEKKNEGIKEGEMKNPTGYFDNFIICARSILE